ncbi:MAG: NAD-dependent epimerase/dehydratase family protein [Desulfobacteraceae bacterium]|nr:MAG: NAD-dependent epimerase/dehydratase family protein [Desulfobacteraceae bacterium]
MPRAFVTGATGFVGYHVAKRLKAQSCDVRALVRKSGNAADLLAIDVEPVPGDIRDPDSVLKGMRGCDQVYHVAADYRLWVPDPETMYDINVNGTANILECARRLKVEKIVYTSTVGVWPGSTDAMPMNENSPSSLQDMIGHYKRSKYMAENEVFRHIRSGLPVVIVNPSTPIGSMDRKPTPTGKIIRDFLIGKIPAYMNTGLNFADVEDVACGHWLAAVRGSVGDRYILGNRNMTLREFFESLARTSGKKPPRIKAPYLPILLAAYADEALSRCFRKREVRVPVTGVKMARKFMYFDSGKAFRELGLPQTPIEAAIKKAVDWFSDKRQSRRSIKNSL